MKEDVKQVIKLAKKDNMVLWSISTGQINPVFVCLEAIDHDIRMSKLSKKLIIEYIELRQDFKAENYLFGIHKDYETETWIIDFYKIIQAV